MENCKLQIDLAIRRTGKVFERPEERRFVTEITEEDRNGSELR
jgi:hypothetical protein